MTKFSGSTPVLCPSAVTPA